ncbi:putative prophage protein [Escherichia coli]|uniref:Putative prophage protein n=1 Tax=Escherichia coli TaxID=562 RepID=A0A376MVP2_ECOLX|nr:putative prophage protein [Escherichia coli]
MQSVWFSSLPYLQWRVSLYSLRNCSRAKAHGANLSDSCSIFLRRLFRAGDNVLVNSLSVIVLSCIAMRRNTLHHGAGDGYSCSLALRRWRYSTSRFNAAVTNCPVLSPGIFTASTLFITSCEPLPQLFVILRLLLLSPCCVPLQKTNAVCRKKNKCSTLDVFNTRA